MENNVTKTYRGSAIIITVLAIAAMMSLSLGVASLVPRDLQQVQALELSQRAEAAAWAGVEQALLSLRQSQSKHRPYDLSQELLTSLKEGGEPVLPYGSLTAALACMRRENPNCPGFDRQLGVPKNQTPVVFRDSLGIQDTYYNLAVWHRRQNGSGTTDLEDGLSAEENGYQLSTNVNPTLGRDEVRRLDVTSATSFNLIWRPFASSRCDGRALQTGETQVRLLYTWLKADGTPYNPEGEGGRNTLLYTSSSFTSQTDTVTNPDPSQVTTLSLRLLVNNALNNESTVTGCFVRYNLENRTADELTDMGFDVIESVGVSGTARRKLRVLVNRESGRPLNIFDFGIACQECE